jgi:hypothetical protein
VFAAAALMSARNLAVASLVLLPVCAAGFSEVGSLRTSDRPRSARLVGALGVAVALPLTLGRLDQRDLNLDAYPVVALSYLEAQGIDTREVRLAEPDIVGNLIGYVYGPERRVFYDDRFDMFPEAVTDAHVALVQTRFDLRDQLREYDIDLVVVGGSSPTAQVLLGDEDWRAMYLDDDWALLCRRGADLGPSAGDC